MCYTLCICSLLCIFGCGVEMRRRTFFSSKVEPDSESLNLDAGSGEPVLMNPQCDLSEELLRK